MSARHAGVVMPLFSAASSASWGIGEIPDLEPLGVWLASAGFDRLMLLPIGTLPDGETSPYSARSSMAIDPVYLAIETHEDFVHAGGVDGMSADARQAIAQARASSHVDYASVRQAKAQAIDRAYAWFASREWASLTTRASEFAGYIARERWWLDDYATYQALSAEHHGEPWMTWPAPLRNRERSAMAIARRRLSHQIRRHQYGQWIADAQWRKARAALTAAGIATVGDLPFVVGADSPDVWAHAGDVDLDVSLGVPPDAFSETGQDWGLPTYRWDAIAANDYKWLRARARRMASLFDAIRIDHLVGFFRTYGRPKDGPPAFRPPDQPSQQAQGEHILGIFLGTGLDVIAEDLGVIPDFVRATLTRLGVPGCKVLRWERAWDDDGAPFMEPRTFASRSSALTGTHDTTPLAVWWDEAEPEERTAWLQLESIASRGLDDPHQPWSDALRDACLGAAYDAASDHLFVPFGDLFGWRDRINTPATVGTHNWTWRVQWPMDTLAANDDAKARAAWCRAEALRTGRGAHDRE